LDINGAAEGDDVSLNTFVGADENITTETDHVAGRHLRSGRVLGRLWSRWRNRCWLASPGQLALPLGVEVTRLEHEIRIGAETVAKLLSRQAFAINGNDATNDLNHSNVAGWLERDKRDTLLQGDNVESGAQTCPEVWCHCVRLAVRRRLGAEKADQNEH
jgi:hypothetical protein